MQGNCIYMCLYKLKYFWKERLIRSVSRKELNGWEKGVGWRHFSIYLFCAVWVTKHMNVLLIQKINEYNRSLEVTEITHHTLAAWADGSLPQISQNSPSLTPVNTLWLYVSASKCPFWPMKPAASFSRIISGPLNLLAFLVPFLSCPYWHNPYYAQILPTYIFLLPSCKVRKNSSISLALRLSGPVSVRGTPKVPLLLASRICL